MHAQVTVPRRRQLAVCVLILVLIPPVAIGRTVAAPVTPSGSVSSGTDLVHLDTDTAHYMSAPGHLLRVRLYNSVVGVPDWPRQQWEFRDLRLHAGATPLALPFDLHVAPTSGSSPQAWLTSEDGVPLSVTVLAVHGLPLRARTGLVDPSGTAITYPGVAHGIDLMLQPTVSGLDLRLILHGSEDPGPVVLSLASDPGEHLGFEQPGGVGAAIVASRDVSHPSPPTTTGPRPQKPPQEIVAPPMKQPEYIIASAFGEVSRADPAAHAHVGLATMALATPAGARSQAVVVTLDPHWLKHADRGVPVIVHIPIATSTAAYHTRLAATVTRCPSTASALLGRLVVGVAHACRYQGVLSFTTNVIQPFSTVQTASLYLYTPQYTGSTGVFVFPNMLGAVGPPWAPPSWNMPPARRPGAVGIGQAGSSGHWQRWDVTSLVRGWVRQRGPDDPTMILVGSGAPVLFATPQWTGDAPAALAPYLDITYAPPASLPPSFYVGGPTIYGIADDFDPDACLSAAGTAVLPECHTPSRLTPQTIAHDLGGSYLRFKLTLPCPPKDQLAASNLITVSRLLADAAADHLTPIIVVSEDKVHEEANKSCRYDKPSPSAPRHTWWYIYMKELGTLLPATLPYLYIEVQNEPDSGESDPSVWQHRNYIGKFVQAAAGLAAAFQQRHVGAYRILTGGVLNPQAAPTQFGCGASNLGVIHDAIQGARGQGVPLAHLGMAVHPYLYYTQRYWRDPTAGGYWRNFFNPDARRYHLPQYRGPCFDLGDMITLWTSLFPSTVPVPVVFTEINWQAGASSSDTTVAAYLLDVLTWLFDHGDTTPQTSLIRVMWYEGVDDGQHRLGIYTHKTLHGTYQSKTVTAQWCPTNPPLLAAPLARAYAALRTSTCY